MQRNIAIFLNPVLTAVAVCCYAFDYFFGFLISISVVGIHLSYRISTGEIEPSMMWQFTYHPKDAEESVQRVQRENELAFKEKFFYEYGSIIYGYAIILICMHNTLVRNIDWRYMATILGVQAVFIITNSFYSHLLLKRRRLNSKRPY